MSNQDIVQQSADNAPVDLAVFDANYAAAKVSTDNQSSRRKYRVRVENVKLSQSPNGTSILTWDLRVMAGQFTGRHLFKHVAITAASLPIIKRDLLVWAWPWLSSAACRTTWSRWLARPCQQRSGRRRTSSTSTSISENL